jgi:[protein-PII] uridylyltransferase
MFSTKTDVSFGVDQAGRRTVMEIVAADRPGLLSTVGQTFMECGINIENAKVVTIGERAEDVFYLADRQGEPLSAAACEELRERLVDRLDRRS